MSPLLNANAAELASLEALSRKAEAFQARITLPVLETTPDAVTAAADKVIADAEAALDRIGAQDLSAVTFASTLKAYDRVVFDVRSAAYRFGLLKDAHPDKAMRDAAEAAAVKIASWGIGVEYREDLYRVVRAFADSQPTLEGEDRRLLDHTLRDYRRAGLALPEAERREVERLRKELTELTSQFSSNVVAATGPMILTAEEVAGIPQRFLDSPGIRQDDGTYKVMLNVTWHWEAVMVNATDPDVRRRAHVIRFSLAKDANIPLMAKIVATRTAIARRLGYATWADYQTEPRMAATARQAIAFEEDLIAGLQPKFEQEVEALRAIKVAETNDPSATIESWDTNYYMEKLKQQRYSVNSEELRAYFPYQATLGGMFALYEKLFNLRFDEVKAPQLWSPEVTLHVVSDRTSGEPLGAFYLDMFPREGKYNHFACFPIQDAAQLETALHVPVAALVCNFPPPSAETPSLLKHEDVITLFHEFGHVMHHVLGRSKHLRFFAFNVEQDFVEAPSQMLENWAWDKGVLDTFAADYRDPSRKVPAELIQALKEARVATSALFYRRQLSFGVLDLALHTQTDPEAPLDVVALTNAELARVSFAPAPDTAFVAYFGHLAGGYDAGYYGYMWALSIAQDLASAFDASPKGLLDESIGLRLRNEIYGAAAARDARESVQAFLGRRTSTEPFLKFVGAK